MNNKININKINKYNYNKINRYYQLTIKIKELVMIMIKNNEMIYHLDYNINDIETLLILAKILMIKILIILEI
jgi:hypothetical protein